jgi:hypothetical protein
VLLDKRRFAEERIQLVGSDLEAYGACAAYEVSGSSISPGVGEVRCDARAEIDGFADVEDSVESVDPEIDAGKLRKAARLRTQLVNVLVHNVGEAECSVGR